MTSFANLARWTSAFVLTAGVGCSATPPGPPPAIHGDAAAMSELRFALTDAPGPFDQILVHLTSIAVHRVGDGVTTPVGDGGADGGGPSAGADDDSGDGAWTTIAALDQTIDLLTLRDGVTLDAGGAPLPAGDYDTVRLGVSSGSVVVAGDSHALTIPSGMQSGVKLRYDLTLAADVSTTVTLDFDGAASIVDTGKHGYLLKPVLKVKSRHDHARPSEAEASEAADGGRAADGA